MMAITVAQLNAHETAITTQTTGSTAQKDAIVAYYNYLDSEGVEYGEIAKEVVLESTTFGEVAGDMIENAGVTGSAFDDLRENLVLRDITERRDDIDLFSGDGDIPASTIATYHYNEFQLAGIDKEDWGGALFEEFGGSGSWITLAKTNALPFGSARDIAKAVVTLEDSNGVDAEQAFAALFAVANFGDETSIQMSWNVTDQILDAVVSTVSTGVEGAISQLITHVKLAEIHDNSDLKNYITSAGETLEFATNGAINYVDSAATATAGLVQGIADAIKDAQSIDTDNIIPNLDGSTFNLTDSSGQKTYTIHDATDSAQLLNFSFGKNILIADGNDTISYANDTVGVDVDLGAGSTLVAGQVTLTPKDTFDNVKYVFGGAGNDIILGDTENNILQGAGGNDDLDGGGGDDSLNGGSGDDTLNGGSDGSNTLNGGTGINTVSYEGYGSGATIDLDTGSATVGGDTDTLIDIRNVIGSSYNDDIVGDGEDNALNGGLGDDTLSSGLGNDTLIGDGGADTFVIANQLNVINEIQSFDRFETDVIDLTDFGNLYGENLNDFLGQYSEQDGSGGRIFNLGMHDRVNKFLTVDEVSFFSSSFDMNLVDAPDQTITGGAGDETLPGGFGDDSIDAGGGNDSVDADMGNDSVDAGDGNDSVEGWRVLSD